MNNLVKSYSVVIPCYNCAETIEDALDSIFNQSYPPKKIVCVDNNSTDSTREILDLLAAKYKNIIILDENQQGASAARNKGSKIVDTDYIQFLDADDILLENKVLKQLKLVNEGTPLIVGNYILNNRNVCFEETDIWSALIKGRLGYTVSNLWPKETFDKLGGFDTKLKTSEEYDLLFKFLKINTPIIFSKDFDTIKQDINPMALTKINQVQNWKRYIDLRLNIYEFLKINDSISNIRSNAFFQSIRVYYIYNKKEAIEIYKKYLKGKFILELDQSISKYYLFLYRLFGFPRADDIISLIKKR